MPKPLRLCDPGCPAPEDLHKEPELDWIGNSPVMHGESEWEVPPDGSTDIHEARPGTGAYIFCLCGHPNYMTCPDAFSDLDERVIRAAGDEEVEW